MNQSTWERIKRRVSLWGGSYTHPDGYIELDFDSKAGIRRDDPLQTRMEKLDRYGAKEASRERLGKRVIGAGLIGLGAYLVASHLQMEHPWAVAFAFGYGTFLLSRQ